ncbi:rab-protein geranylgeranyltransferase [Boletus reticuloceps]|uniref:Geranylgeranyl transferase type-2 subunit alpha n=1 Tax=Boletus reticuloceps TaxID=495285 RepID=A0A8I3AE64_9AGAM|nr:rab-protein geranylgeranyltransferase [Boletus reticuloceps]
MHNVKRVPHSQEAIQARKERERSQIVEYLALTNNVLSRKKTRDWSRDAFDQTQQLLELNPEFYTIWNYRRNIILNGIFPQSTPEENNDLLANELSMTMAALREHPKVYWIWNHRRWCLENVPDGPVVDGKPSLQWRKANWQRELAVVEKMLDADARNFLAWNYRRYVLASMPEQRPVMTELAYTTRKISASFSNFSAWHQRSKVYSSLWNTGELDPIQSREEEFDLVHNALFTDPDDQSAWIYHRWLIGSGENEEQLRQEIAIIEELLGEQPDSKWCMDSLVYYCRLLLKNHGPDSEDIKQKCYDLLQQLERIDVPRKLRYQEIGQGM